MVNVTDNEQIADIVAMRAGLGRESDKTEAARGYVMTSEQTALFDKIFDAVQKEQSKNALELAATAFTRTDWKNQLQTGILQGRSDTGERIDSAKVANPAAKNTAESVRMDTAVKRTNTYLQFCRGGLGSLKPGDANTLIAEATKFISGDPNLVRLYADSTGANIDPAKVRQFVDSRQFKNLVAARLNQIYDGSTGESVKQLEKTHTDALEELEKKKVELGQKEAEHKVLKDELDKALEDKKKFDTPQGKSSTSMLDELNALAGNPDIQSAIEAKNEVDEAYDRFTNEPNRQMRQLYYNEYMAAFQKLAAARTNIQGDQTKKDNLARYEILKDQKNNIERRLEAAAQTAGSIKKLELEIGGMKAQMRGLRIAEADARHERERVSVALPEDLESVMYDATQEYIEKFGASERELSRKILEGEDKKVKDKAEKSAATEAEKAKERIDKAISVKYLSEQTVKNPNYSRWSLRSKEPPTYKAFKADVGLINQDRAVVFDPNRGPQVVIEGMLLDAVCPGAYTGGTCNDADAQKRLESMRGDKAYMDGMQDKLLVNMLVNMKEAGNMPRPEEVKILVTSEKLAPIVDKYLTQSKEIEAVVTKYQDAGVLPKDMGKTGWGKEILKRFGSRELVIALLIALAAVGGFPAAGAAAASLGSKFF